MNAIVIAVISVTAIGAICAFMLTVASKFMNVKTDERIMELLEILPGVNCGVCGYPGCEGYAKALAASQAKENLCTPGGQDVLSKISGILGIESTGIEKKTAIITCIGTNKTQQKKMEYNGIYSCAGAKPLYGGENACAFGCLGYGDCKGSCPSGAICLEDGLARIKTHLCTGCGLCVKTCPNNLISIVNDNIPVYIACINIEKGAVTRKKCINGCIGCGKCERECPHAAITMADNLAFINYEKCTGCSKCKESCPVKCIISRQFH